jgi:hypothetical protein
VQQPFAQLPDSLLWAVPRGHHLLLMLKVKHVPTRLWYMQQTLANGWSRNVLLLMIKSRDSRSPGPRSAISSVCCRHHPSHDFRHRG